MATRPIITLTTDYGLRDAYVASIKGVILSINPAALLVDITHEVPPQDLLHGAYVLGSACSHYPAGTIHLAVVDPGVGSARKAIAVSAKGQRFVAPDNGILSLALPGEAPRVEPPQAGVVVEGPLSYGMEAYELMNPQYHRAEVSATFHGRDIFGPVAAHLSLGVPMAQLGPAMSRLKFLEAAYPSVTAEGVVHGTVIHVDGFGNVITNVRPRHLPKGLTRVEVAGQTIEGLSKAYAERAGLLAVWGSDNYLEVALQGGNAAQSLGLKRGDAVKVWPAS